MQIILFTILGALILIWGAIWAMVRWLTPFQTKHLLGFGGYVSVVCGALIFLVIHTSLTQQETALKDTRSRLSQELETFRQRLGELTDRLMGQIAEKAELTESEWKVRGDLQTERDQHARTRNELAKAREQLRDTQAELLREADAHRAYLDSLNTARALLQDTRDRLQREERAHGETRRALEGTQEGLAKTRERLAVQQAEVERLQGALRQAEARLQQALENAAVAQKRLQDKLASQQEALEVLQASVDSLFMKEFKRPRPPIHTR